MKYYIPIIACLLLISGLTSCNQNSYSAKRAAEDKLIEDFIERQHIHVIAELPEDSVWGETDYMKVPGYDNMYIHIVRYGDTNYAVKEGDKVLVRYIRYTLDAIADTARYMTTAEQAYPTEFAYLIDYTTAPQGWHIAVKYMRHSGAACKIICPSKLGLDAENSSVTPYGYDMQIQIPRY